MYIGEIQKNESLYEEKKGTDLFFKLCSGDLGFTDRSNRNAESRLCCVGELSSSYRAKRPNIGVNH